MRVHGNVDVNDHRVTNNVTNITNVTIEAPPGATANGRPFQGSVPARSHLAASLPAIVHAQAPVPVSGRPIPSYVPGRPPAALPAPQALRGERSERGGRGDSPQGQPQQQPWQAQNPQPQQQQQQQQRPGTDNTAGRPDFASPPRQPAQIGGTPGAQQQQQQQQQQEQQQQQQQQQQGQFRTKSQSKGYIPTLPLLGIQRSNIDLQEIQYHLQEKRCTFDVHPLATGNGNNSNSNNNSNGLTRLPSVASISGR